MKFMLVILFIFLCGCTLTHSKEPRYKILINGNEQCKYDYSNEDFCSDYNLDYYKRVDKNINFDKNKILVMPDNNFGYIVVVNPKDNTVYPFKYLIDYNILNFNKNSNDFCIEGDVSYYRDEDSGYLCFEFINDVFEKI